MGDATKKVRWPRRLAVLTLLALVLAAGVYYAVTGWAAYRDLTATRTQLLAATESAPTAAQVPLESATQYAHDAAARLDSPMWAGLAAVPLLGDTAQAARQVTFGLDQTLQSLQPLVDHLGLLQPRGVVKDGRIDIAAIQSALPAAEQALPGVGSAQQDLQSVGGAIPSQLRGAAVQLRDQVDEIHSTLQTVVEVGPIATPLLGGDGTKRYFVGLLNPNETRGTGGFLGTYAIATAQDGALTIGDIGSNTDLPTLSALPPGLSKGFRARYRDDPTLVGNMNLSPHFPDTARIWLAAWQQKTGQRLDGAIAVDTVTLGRLVEAAGVPVTLPDGGSLTGSQLADFSNIEVYKRFPTAAESAQRKAYQEAVTQSALNTVTTLPEPLPMAQALGRGFSEHRIVVWSSDHRIEKLLDDAGASGTIVVPAGHRVDPVVINASGSKLDAYLEREVQYEVGRCDTDRVTSTVTVWLRSDIPLGERPPPYMVGSARRIPTGPVNSVLLQLHMPDQAQLQGVRVDGKQESSFTFRQAGRPAALVSVDLPPRKRREVRFTFTEPNLPDPGEVTLQPLFRDERPVVLDKPC